MAALIPCGCMRASARDRNWVATTIGPSARAALHIPIIPHPSILHLSIPLPRSALPALCARVLLPRFSLGSAQLRPLTRG